MALPNTTVTANSPAKLVAAENPIIISLSTGAAGSALPARMRINVVDVETDGLTLTFNLTYPQTYTKVFTAKDFPNSDSYFFTNILKDRQGNTIDSSITQPEITQSLAEAIQKDIVISQNYYVNYSGGTYIFLVAKEPSAKFNLNGKLATSNGSELGYTNIFTGSSAYQGSQINEYSLFVETFTSDQYQFGQTLNLTNFNRVTETVLPFRSDNIHRFDQSSICKAFVSTTKPDFTVTAFTVSNYMKPFAFRYGEIYPVVANENTKKKFYKGTINPVWIANAALDHTDANTLVSLTGSTANSNFVDIPFITNSPQVKMSNRSSATEELLYYILPSFGSSSFKLYADYSFWNGAEVNEVFVNNVSKTAGGLQGLNLTYNQLTRPIANNILSPIRNINVYLRNGTANQLLINNEFEANLNNWSQINNGITGSTVFGWSPSNNGRALAYLGSHTSAIPHTTWDFNTDLSGWANNLAGGNPDQWTWSSNYGGSARLNSNDQPFGFPNLRKTSLSLPTQPFYFVVNYVVNPALPNSSNLKMSIVFQDASNLSTFNQQFTTSFTGSDQSYSVLISDSNVWNNSTSINIVPGSTNINGGDSIYITNIALATIGTVVFTKTYFLTQDSLTLDPSRDYRLRYNVTFSGGTGNYLKARFYNVSNTAIGSEMVLVSNQGVGTFTGTTNISDTLNSTIKSLRVWSETNSSGSQFTHNFNSFAIEDISPLPNTTLVKTFEYPFSDPQNIYGVAFQNKLGTFDTFDFIGLKEESIERSSKEITYATVPNADGSLTAGFKHSASYDVKVTKKITVNSGWIDQAHFDWILELLSSNEIFEYNNPSLNYLKLDSYKYQKNNQSSEYSVEVTFIATTYENSVSI